GGGEGGGGGGGGGGEGEEGVGGGGGRGERRDRIGAGGPGDLQGDQQQRNELPRRTEQGPEPVVQRDEHQGGDRGEPEHQRDVVDGDPHRPVQGCHRDHGLHQAQ